MELKTSIYSAFKHSKILPAWSVRWCCGTFKELHGTGRVNLVGVRNDESYSRSKIKEVEVSRRKFSGSLEEFGQWSAERIEHRTGVRDRRIKRLSRKKDKQFDQFAHHEEQMVTCVGGKDKIVVSPIIHWSEENVWEFLNNVLQVPHCELYDEGWTRIGCIGCPMSSTKFMKKDFERWPYVKEKWIQAVMEIREKYKDNPNSGKNTCWFGKGSDANFSDPNKPSTDREIAENVIDYWVCKKKQHIWFKEKFNKQNKSDGK